MQQRYNEEHGITPQTVQRRIRPGIESVAASRREPESQCPTAETPETSAELVTQELLDTLHDDMLEASEQLDFERAASLRDQIQRLQEHLGKPLAAVPHALRKSRGPSASDRSEPAKRGGKGRRIPRPKRN